VAAGQAQAVGAGVDVVAAGGVEVAQAAHVGFGFELGERRGRGVQPGGPPVWLAVSGAVAGYQLVAGLFQPPDGSRA
jgi:hypothetical protein